MPDSAHSDHDDGTEGEDRPRAVALVILRSPSGAARDADLTASTISRHLPEPEGAAATAARLSASGFRVWPAVGISFAIEGTPEQFHDFFGITPVRVPDGGWTWARGGDELSFDAVPQPLREQVATVAFERPAQLHDPMV